MRAALILCSELANMEISGPLPAILSKLDELSDLELDKNLFTGTLPEEWVNLGKNAKFIKMCVACLFPWKRTNYLTLRDKTS